MRVSKEKSDLMGVCREFVRETRNVDTRGAATKIDEIAAVRVDQQLKPLASMATKFGSQNGRCLCESRQRFSV